MSKYRKYGVITTKGKFIPQQQLEEFALKSIYEDSEQLDSREGYIGNGIEMARPYSMKTLAMFLENDVTHNTACRVKAGDIAGNGWEIKPLLKNADFTNQSDIEDWLENMEIDICDVFEESEQDYHGLGEEFVEIVRYGRNPNEKIVNMYHLPTVNMTFIKDKNIAVQTIGNQRKYFKKYGYQKDVDCLTGIEYPLGELSPEKKATEFFYDRVYNPTDDYYGSPYILPAIGAVFGNMYARNWNNSIFENMGVPAYAILVSGNYSEGETDEDGRTDLQKMLEANIQAFADNPNSVAILTVPSKDGEGSNNVEVKWEKIGVDMKDASFLEFFKMNKQEIATAHLIPMYLLGDNSDSTGALGGSNSEQAIEIYKRSVVEKRQNKLERFINRVIKDCFGETGWEFKFKNIDRKDENEELDNVLKVLDKGILTLGQAIKILGDKYSVEPTTEDVMDMRFYNGQPLVDDVANAILSEAQESLKSLKENTKNNKKSATKGWF